MRIDNKPVESPKITWAECRREQLLLRRLVLVSAMELGVLALVVFLLIATVSFVEGQRDLAIRTSIASAVIVLALALFEFLFRVAKRRLGALDAIVQNGAGDQPA